MMLTLEHDGSVGGEYDARLAVVGVGALGQQVVAMCAAAGLPVQLFRSDATIAARPTDNSPALFSDSADGPAESQSPSAAALLFIAGELTGELEACLRVLSPILPDRTQAVVAIAALPPSYQGHAIRSTAVQELEALTAAGATVIVIDSDQALRELDLSARLEDYRKANATQMAAAIQAVTDLLVVTGEVNVDFADVVLVLRKGTAGHFATGRGAGLDRATTAVSQALARAGNFPALRSGAQGCLINITGDLALTIEEVTTIAAIVQEAIGDEAEIIFGAVHDPSLSDVVCVSTLWTGYQPSALSYDHGHSVLTAVEKRGLAIEPRRRRVTSRSLKVFLASPSDVSEEREAARRVIDELNLQNASRWGSHLELVRWETHALPSMGRPQEVVIDTTKLTDVDIFIGLLWSRLGTPTGGAESGTVEEFNEAYASWRKHGRPWIAFYFCDRPVQYGGVGGAEQFLGVARFREQFPEKGMYFTFGSTHQLEQLLSRHIPRIVEQILDRRHGAI